MLAADKPKQTLDSTMTDNMLPRRTVRAKGLWSEKTVMQPNSSAAPIHRILHEARRSQFKFYFTPDESAPKCSIPVKKKTISWERRHQCVRSWFCHEIVATRLVINTRSSINAVYLHIVYT